MRGRALPIVLGAILIVLIIAGVLYVQNKPSGAGASIETTAQTTAAVTAPSSTPLPNGLESGSPQPTVSPGMPAGSKVDLGTNANGLSNVTVVMNTNEGVIKFKFYPKDAPDTVQRMVDLIQQGFYNGLTFHRVVPGFVIQGGDPTGTGAGGSGQKLKAEFNNRHHIEGTVAMARAQDPDSADSQFYISLGAHPHLDHQYTIFGQVTEGMDVARKIKVGDKMTSVSLQ